MEKIGKGVGRRGGGGHSESEKNEKDKEVEEKIPPEMDPGLMKQVHLLPWNFRSSTPGSSFLSASPLAVIPPDPRTKMEEEKRRRSSRTCGAWCFRPANEYEGFQLSCVCVMGWI